MEEGDSSPKASDIVSGAALECSSAHLSNLDCESSKKEAVTKTLPDSNEKETVTNSALPEEESAESSTNAAQEKEFVKFKVIFLKRKLDLHLECDSTIAALKQHLESLIDVPASMQKIMFRGLARDEATLRQLSVTNGAKVMVVGSTVSDVLSIAPPSKAEVRKAEVADRKKATKLCEQELHKKILAKHSKPDDLMPALRGVRESLPHTPLTGMFNKYGAKVRLNFKLETDELIISTKERTTRVPMNTIKNVVSGDMSDQQDYHIVGFQLGPTEASIYWVYYVPAQYVEAIKDIIMGQWPS